MKLAFCAVVALCAIVTTCRAQTEHVVTREDDCRFSVGELHAFVGDTITIRANFSLIGLTMGRGLCDTSEPVETSETSFSMVLGEPGIVAFYCLCARDLFVTVFERPGGCCFNDGACSVSTASGCAEDGGSFFGANTTCQSQACCAEAWYVEHPQDQSVQWGESLVLSASFSTLRPLPGGVLFQWYKDGAPVRGEARVRGTGGTTLLIDRAKKSDAGTYMLVARTACGEEPSMPVEVEVRCPPPRITTAPAANTLVQRGKAFTLKVKASGNGRMTYQWYKDGVRLKRGPRIKGVVTATLNIKNARRADAATYTCVVTDECGSVTTSTFAGRVQVR